MPTTPPAWVADAVFYQIFPDRFAKSDEVPKPTHLEAWDAPPTLHGYKGGDLIGIVEHLDWLTDLGVTAIYLNPIFWSASNHRYHTYDYFRVDPMLGDNAAFDRLIDESHRRGLRVVIDGVFNHASRGFFPFHDVAENGQSSPWSDWFHISGWPIHPYEESKPANYDAWWGLRALPKLNTDNPEVRAYLMRVAEHWIERGADGWRLDVPEEIHTEGFWEEFRDRVKAVNPDAYLVGEIWHDASAWINEGRRFDGTMNYLFAGYTLAFTGGHRIEDDMARGLNYPVQPALDAPAYADRIGHLLDIYTPEALQASLVLLGSHDTPRVLGLVGGDIDSVLLAFVLQFTFPGAPSIFYGDEIGLDGGREPDSRKAFPWEHPERWNQEILSGARKLVQARHDHPALRRGTYRPLAATGGLVVFSRETEDETILVAVNAGDRAESVSFDDASTAGRTYQTVWGNGGVKASGNTVRIALPPRTAGVWEVGR